MVPLTFEEQIEFLTTSWTSKTLEEFFNRVESKFTKQELENFKNNTFDMISEGLKKVLDNQEPSLKSEDIVKEWKDLCKNIPRIKI